MATKAKRKSAKSRNINPEGAFLERNISSILKKRK
jgi:hypothetical protein